MVREERVESSEPAPMKAAKEKEKPKEKEKMKSKGKEAAGEKEESENLAANTSAYVRRLRREGAGIHDPTKEKEVTQKLIQLIAAEAPGTRKERKELYEKAVQEAGARMMQQEKGNDPLVGERATDEEESKKDEEEEEEEEEGGGGWAS